MQQQRRHPVGQRGLWRYGRNGCGWDHRAVVLKKAKRAVPLAFEVMVAAIRVDQCLISRGVQLPDTIA